MKAIILSLIRHGLTAGGAYLVSIGVAGNDEMETVVGAVVAIVAVAHSVITKYRAKKDLERLKAAKAFGR